MLFSSPDYPLFLIAVFFLYALARWGSASMAWARIAVMLLLGDVVFMLVAKDPDALWDPIGGALCRLAVADDSHDPAWPAWLIVHWLIGSALVAVSYAIGRRKAAWIASPRGQQLIARGLVVGLAAIAATVIAASRAG